MKRYLVVGLGNPGQQYRYTRHNVGFMAVDYIASQHNISFDKQKKQNAFVGDGMIAEKRVMLVKPQTYMNNSGVAVRGLADYYDIPPERILIIVDDLDTDLGSLRIRAKGGAAGQNGTRSIIQHLGTQDFPRIRFGIGRPPGKMAGKRYVLMPFIKSEEDLAQETVWRTEKAVYLWLKDGIDMAMNRQNGTAEQAANAAPKSSSPKD